MDLRRALVSFLLAAGAAAPAYAQTALGVTRYSATGNGAVNTWVVNAPEGLIVVDFQADVPGANAAIAAVKALGRPVRALLLTHAHADHIGGMAAFRAAFPGVPMYASAHTQAQIAHDSLGYQKLAKEFYKDKAPAAYPVPDTIVDPGTPLTVAGLTIEAMEWGQGESLSATTYYLPDSRQLFAGDVVANATHAFLGEQRTGPWLTQLEKLHEAYPAAATLYPGHGAEGPADALIADTRTYLLTYREEVRLAMQSPGWNGDDLSASALHHVAEVIERRFPGRAGNLRTGTVLEQIEQNATAVAQELENED